MKDCKCKCTYCGISELLEYKYDLRDRKCPICGQKDWDITQLRAHEILDTYAGAPPFPDKPIKEELVEEDGQDTPDDDYNFY